MAVPKRKMSRSNTRSRRAQWKATAARPGAVQPLPRAQARARGVPHLRHLQRPRRPRRLSVGERAAVERGRRTTGRTGSPSCSTSPSSPGLLAARADPPLVRLRERRPADQRAPRVPRRLGARARRHRHALPQPPRAARGPAGQAARRRRQHARARRRRPRPRAWATSSGSAAARRATGGRDKSSILADTLEAVLGAVYIDLGLDAAAGLVHRLFDPLIDAGRDPRAPAWTGRPACRS